MATAAWVAASPLSETRKGHTVPPVQPSVIYLNTDVHLLSFSPGDPQTGRIVRTHWLRPEPEELDHG